MSCRISYTKVSHSSAQFSGALGVTSSEGASLPGTPDGAAVPGHGATKLYCSGYCSTAIYVPGTQEKSVHELDYIGTLRKPGSWTNTIFDILLYVLLSNCGDHWHLHKRYCPEPWVSFTKSVEILDNSYGKPRYTVTYHKTKQLPEHTFTSEYLQLIPV